MCYQKVHQCKYCNTLYSCSLIDWVCPTLNDDQDRNMCNICRGHLERELQSIENHKGLSIEDILKDDE